MKILFRFSSSGILPFLEPAVIKAEKSSYFFRYSRFVDCCRRSLQEPVDPVVQNIAVQMDPRREREGNGPIDGGRGFLGKVKDELGIFQVHIFRREGEEEKSSPQGAILELHVVLVGLIIHVATKGVSLRGRLGKGRRKNPDDGPQSQCGDCEQDEGGVVERFLDQNIGMFGLPGDVECGIGTDRTIIMGIDCDIGRVHQEVRGSFVGGIKGDLEGDDMFSPEAVMSKERMNQLRTVIGIDADLDFCAWKGGFCRELGRQAERDRFGGIKRTARCQEENGDNH